MPKNDIERTIQSFQNIRLIQLINWPSVRQHILKEYPMIQSMNLSFTTFPKIQINITEKQPWAIIVHEQKHHIVSKDGTLLNQKLRDVELPDFPIMMINSATSIVKNNMLDEPYRLLLNELSIALSTIPFFQLQQIKLTEKSIQLLEVNGREINLGDFSDISEKMRSFKYF